MTGLHVLLTYTCTSECDHCFLWCSPRAGGTFTLAQLEHLLDQAQATGTIHSVYFEGGEPTLFYPLLLAGVRAARERGFGVGVVTNGYFAVSEDDALLWLAPLRELRIVDLSISDDELHSTAPVRPSERALAAARRLGMPVSSICLRTADSLELRARRGQPVVGGTVLFRGRAAETLTRDLPRRPWHTFTECPHEDLVAPDRVHVDAFGNLQLCQGLSAGNCWRTPLAEWQTRYVAEEHPICGPLVRGGPAELSRTFGVPHEEGYVDACHLCYVTRKALLERFPQELAPRQAYGLD